MSTRPNDVPTTHQRPNSGQPVVIAAVENRANSLAALLLAAQIAHDHAAKLHVIHVEGRHFLLTMSLSALARVFADQADAQAREELSNRVSDVLYLGAAVSWWFTCEVGNPVRVLVSTVAREHPLAVVVGSPRHPRRPTSLIRRIIGRRGLPVVIVPA